MSTQMKRFLVSAKKKTQTYYSFVKMRIIVVCEYTDVSFSFILTLLLKGSQLAKMKKSIPDMSLP